MHDGVARLDVPPEEFDKTRAIGADAGLNRVNLGVARVMLKCPVVRDHVEGEWIIDLAAVFDQHPPYGVGLQAELACYRIVRPVELWMAVSRNNV